MSKTGILATVVVKFFQLVDIQNNNMLTIESGKPSFPKKRKVKYVQKGRRF